MTTAQSRLVFTITLLSIVCRVPWCAATDPDLLTYSLSQSSDTIQLWTAPPSHRVLLDEELPVDVASGVSLCAAQNEFEPFQLIVRPTTAQPVPVTIGDFGAGISVELYQVKYVTITQATDSLGRTGPYPDPLMPLENGTSVSLQATLNTSFWFSVSVPATTPAGDYSADVTVGAITVPISLHVFDFAIPNELHVKSQMNFSHNTILQQYGVSGTGAEYWQYVDAIKQFFIDHRLTLKSTLWSGGLTGTGAAPYIDYDCGDTLSDTDGIWGFEEPAARYLDGTGLMNGTFTESFNDGDGFPSFMAATFLSNDPSADQRPSTFCGSSRSSLDWYTADNPTSPYNQKWFRYISTMESYLTSMGYLDKAYYYFANEPQDQGDYDAVAWYSRYLKQAAPNLKLMVSENPKAEIFNNANYSADGQIDIWMPVLNEYDPVISQDRELNHNEETWIYFLHGTRPPYFNPITLDHPGIESKFTGWFLWKYRIRGIAYYSLNNWSLNPWTDPLNDNHNGDLFMLYPPSEDNTPIAYGSNNHRFVPSIRFELMRDSMEDYEYLYILNGNNPPEVDQVNPADTQANKVISALTSYTRNDAFMYTLRRLIGEKNGGEIAVIPDLQPPPMHPRAEGLPGNYYINFQNPAGSPTANPLVVNGNEYMKIGWNTFDATLGYGWYGDMANVLYQYVSGGADELQNSIIYDNWGREKTFEFDLPNGTYSVTVSVGWAGKTYSRNQIVIEGVDFITDEASSPYLVRTREVAVADNKLTMEMGIFDEYTMLNSLDIEAVQIPAPPVAQFFVNTSQGSSPLTVQFTDTSTNSPIAWQWDFNNDSIIDSTLQNPLYTYQQTGTYSVRLTASNTDGSDESIRENLIMVTGAQNTTTGMPWLYLLLLKNSTPSN